MAGIWQHNIITAVMYNFCTNHICSLLTLEVKVNLAQCFLKNYTNSQQNIHKENVFKIILLSDNS